MWRDHQGQICSIVIVPSHERHRGEFGSGRNALSLSPFESASISLSAANQSSQSEPGTKPRRAALKYARVAIFASRLGDSLPVTDAAPIDAPPAAGPAFCDDRLFEGILISSHELQSA
jgi:hypothetical protein